MKNTIQLIGQFDKPEEWQPGEFDILLSPMPYKQALADIEKLPDDVISRVFTRPLKYKHIDIGRNEPDIHGLKTPYMQVKDNYKYWYVFSNPNECIWKRTKRSRDGLGEAVLQIKNLKHGLFDKMCMHIGNDWIYDFFMDTTGKSNLNRIDLIWSSADKFAV